MQEKIKWTDTYSNLSEADRNEGLAPGELVSFATVAYLTGRNAESFQLLERAHQLFLDQNQLKPAARSAFWLGLFLMDAGESARSGGWFGRGARVLGDQPDINTPERALFLIPEGLRAFYSGQYELSEELFKKAAGIGEKHQDMDLITLSRLAQGQSLVHQGRIPEGLQLLDETMVLVGMGRVNPVAVGIIYCAGIETCRKIWDLSRAQEWTMALQRWCRSHEDIVPFRGQCLVNRAEIIQFHGEWDRALVEARKACEILSHPPGKPAAGNAFYRRAEILRLIGKYEESETYYQEASKWGRNLQPGMALLRLAQGDQESAEISIRHSLREASEPLKRVEILPAFVHIMLVSQHPDEAVRAVEELQSIVEKYDSPFLQGLTLKCTGSVAMHQDQWSVSIDCFGRAMSIWNNLNLPYESAQTLEMKGLSYRQLGDRDNSAAALSQAKWLYEQLGAVPDLDRLNHGLHQDDTEMPFGLTFREFQVLRMVAEGRTNKAIGAELFISTRTVDRHVSNIFNKLQVTSRLQATTLAIRHKILDGLNINRM